MPTATNIQNPSFRDSLERALGAGGCRRARDFAAASAPIWLIVPQDRAAKDAKRNWVTGSGHAARNAQKAGTRSYRPGWKVLELDRQSR